MFAIEASRVSKQFGSNTVLNGIDLQVPQNSVFGFLGNNGAGKSTFIRSLLGLLRYSGEFTIFGESIARNDYRYKHQIGALVDSPSLYTHLTATEFLTIAQRIKSLPFTSIDEVLEIVDLTEVRDEKIEFFSLGMKQRLALAQALIGKPRLLVLDEPTNGLDPAGIVEIRELLSSLPKQMDVTVFLSSHLLDEIEKTATHVAILKDGKISLQSELADLLTQMGQHLYIRSQNTADVSQLLIANGWFVETTADHVIAQNCSEEDAIQIHQLIHNHQLPLIESRLQQDRLEKLFHQHNSE